MMLADLPMLVAQCAPDVHPATMQAVVRTESGGNPYAIGVVGGRLVRQPRTLGEAVATANALARSGWNYSVGLAQVNRSHLAGYGLSGAAAFDVCRNLAAGADILARCYTGAVRRGPAAHDAHVGPVALRDALSCYTSGNFQTGYRTGYVQRVVMSAARDSVPAQRFAVPAIDVHEIIPVIHAEPSSAEAAARAARPTHPVRRDGTAWSDDANGSGQANPADAAATPDNSAVVF
ncbi:lytic transglycosylase domain-containing protein [Burkholderia multivorans]|uniref:lytic transglycosylase domain-containing protein n=1 Tax=Burkholderia multivorans TaxID=87883 RepID=UPI001C2350A0|nr:lytic transglycosylase domain-containing protein [Burkholderia multivorans]MBU9205450.1 lytic transglycosylase domain-containing protein [Burkholderia multivorans]MCO8353459.1 lytic transglycosylase domain-containing protein [Burkholderia multivorans]MCO8385718.1 lytic transglycosylase domain-containing protein [Burkholderia multivorans]MCO8406601.1 lytic transglycosylase domain-containing protein [Burkholderia multivorans]MCO8434814.1 lytic transglycosylase domain-containing protein [Burkh